MKKAFFTTILLVWGLSVQALEAIPMVDVQINQGFDSRTEVPRGFGDAILKGFVKAFNDELRKVAEGTLAVQPGDRATVIIDSFDDPSDTDSPVMQPSGFSPFAARKVAFPNPEYGRTGKMKVSGYIVFKDKRIPFEEVMAQGSPAEWLAAQLGEQTFRRLRAL